MPANKTASKAAQREQQQLDRQAKAERRACDCATARRRVEAAQKQAEKLAKRRERTAELLKLNRKIKAKQQKILKSRINGGAPPTA